MKDLIAQAKNIKNDGYTDETWNKLQSEIKSAEKLMQYTGEDKGAAQLSSAYDKTATMLRIWLTTTVMHRAITKKMEQQH